MQTKRIHRVIVLEHSGGVAGVVTFKDIFEELIGYIYDEMGIFIEIRKATKHKIELVRIRKK